MTVSSKGRLSGMLWISAALCGVCALIRAAQIIQLAVLSIRHCGPQPQTINYFDALEGNISAAPSPGAYLDALLMLAVMVMPGIAVIDLLRGKADRRGAKLCSASCAAMSLAHLGRCLVILSPFMMTGHAVNIVPALLVLAGAALYALAAWLFARRPLRHRSLWLVIGAQAALFTALLIARISSGYSLPEMAALALAVGCAAYGPSLSETDSDKGEHHDRP